MLPLIMKLFSEYPPGTRVKLTEEYDSRTSVVVGYRSYYDDWYLRLDDDTSIHINRLDSCIAAILS